jgi:phosphopantetheine adenylyltransferase
MYKSKVRRRDLGWKCRKAVVCLIWFSVVEGYVWRYAKREGATVFFRGIRSWEKDGSDERSLQILNTWGPMLLGPLVWPIPTIYLEGNPKYNHVSSTLIRDLCKSDGNNNAKDSLAELVPPNVANLVSSLYSAKDQ